MTEAELLDRISSKELSKWFALYQIEAEDRQAEKDRIEAGPDGQVFDPRQVTEDDASGDESDDGDGETE